MGELDTKALEARFGDRYRRGEPMSRHTNYRIGGPADHYLEVRDADEAEAALAAFVGAGIPYFILGGGSNLLVSDEGYRGAIVRMAMREVKVEGTRVIADAGAPTGLLSRTAADAGLSGLEWAIGIPGTVGGAVRGNAGSFGGEMKDSIESVEVIVVGDGSVSRETWPKAKCGFSYRTSEMKRMSPAPVILSATFALVPGDKAGIKARMDEVMTKRKAHQPLSLSSAGCVFTNVDLKGDEDLSRLLADTDVPKEFIERKRIPSGWLIQEAGLKGAKVGDARISEEHGNFCVNMGSATADEVAQLVSLVKTRIRDRYGLELKEEIQYLGF